MSIYGETGSLFHVKNEYTKRTKNMKDLLHPSLLQINYLMTLEKIEKKRGCVGTVADICGVSHGPVSRFFTEKNHNPAF